MHCPHCQQIVQVDWKVCAYCNTPLVQQAHPTTNPYASTDISPNHAAPPITDHEGDATGGLIPYKNPKALIAYYLGIVSGLPLIGFPLGIVAFVLGILGLRDRKRNPIIKGAAHAWIGIGCGGVFAIAWGLAIIAIVVSIITG